VVFLCPLGWILVCELPLMRNGWYASAFTRMTHASFL